MKKKLTETSLKRLALLSFMLFFSGIVLFGQEVQFPRAVISSGGGNFSSNAVNLTRWRIGQINVVTITLDGNLLKQATISESAPSEKPVEEWSVDVYPNPVNSMLNVHFNIESQREFTLEIYDMTGRKLIAEDDLTIAPGQVSEIDLTRLTPAFYLLKVIPAIQGTQKLFKIIKQ